MFVRRTDSDHHLEFTRFYDEMHRAIVKAQIFSRERELDASFLSGPQRDALKTFQFFNWSSHTGGDVADIKLHDFIANALAGILYFYAHRKPAIGSYARRAHLQIRQPKLCVAQSITERKKRRPRHVQIFRCP